MLAITPMAIDETTHLSEESRQTLRDLITSGFVKPILCRWCYKAFVVPGYLGHPPPHLHWGIPCSGNTMDYLDEDDAKNAKRCTSAFELLMEELGLEKVEQEDLYKAMTEHLKELGRLLRRIGEQEDQNIREKALYTRDLADRLASDFAWVAARTGSNYDYARAYFASLVSEEAERED